MSKKIPGFSNDDAVEAMLNYLTEVSEENTGYDDDLEVTFQALPDGMGWQVTILSEGTHLCHSAAPSVKDALWKSITRLSVALEEAKEAAEAELDD